MTSKSIRKVRTSIISAAMILALCACSGGDPSAKGEADPNGKIRIASHLGLSSWDPARSTGGPELQLFSLVYDRLMRLNRSGELQPGAAETWAFEADGKTLALTLREGMTFDDGTPLNAAVAKQNLERYMTLPESTLSAMMSNIASIEANGNTLRITQREPDSGLPSLLADRPGLLVNPAKFTELASDDIPSGSGQFTVTTQEPGVSMALKKNPAYWDADAIKVAEAEISVIADATARLNAVRTGQVDLARIDPEQVEEAESATNLTVTDGPMLETINLYLNPALEPAFAKPEVREAISIAVDRQAIVDGILFGHGTATAQYYPEGHPAHAAGLEERLRPNPDHAKELLARAGYKDGLVFETVVFSPKSDRVAQAIQAQLAAIGIEMNLKPLPGYGAGQAFTGNQVASGIMTGLPRVEPSLQFRAHFLPNQFWNPGDMEEPELTALIRASIAETDVDKRHEIDRQISTFIATKPMNSMTFYTVKQILVSRDNIQGVETGVDGFPYVDGVTVTK